MKEPSIDPERLAGLLDGRLDEQQRKSLLEELARSEESLDALGDAAELMHDLELAGAVPDAADPSRWPAGDASLGYQSRVSPRLVEPREGESTGPRSVDRESRFWPGRWGSRWSVLATAAVLVLAVGVPFWSRNTASSPSGPGELVALLDVSAPANESKLPDIEWPTTRGAVEQLAPRARAVRFGAQAIELELAVRDRDAGTVSRVAGQVAALFGGQAGSSPAVEIYRRVSANPSASADSLKELLAAGWSVAVPLVDSDVAELGAWLAVVRVAAARRDTAFRGQRALDRALSGLESIAAQEDVPMRRTAARVRAAAMAGSVSRWDVLEQDVAALLVALGR